MSNERVLLKTHDGFTKIVEVTRDDQEITIERIASVKDDLSKNESIASYEKVTFADSGDRNNLGMRIFQQEVK